MLSVGESYAFKFMSTNFYDKLRTFSIIPIVKSQQIFTCSK